MQDNTTDQIEPHALGLTVYDLPEPGAVADQDARRTAMGRLRMLLVMLICAAPVVASYFTLYVLRPSSVRSFGELIQPVKHLPDVSAIDLQGKTVPMTSLQGQWLLVSVAPAVCNADLQQNLYLQRQIRAALGREKDRTDWLWLVSDDAPVDPQLVSGLTEALVLRLPQPQIHAWLSPADGQAVSDHLYLVDPHGDWMMRFPAKLTPEQAPQLRRDWERLLRASVSWDQPGR
jgi:hypothetical protein